MQVKHFHFYTPKFNSPNSNYTSTATIFVEGLGEICITDCMSIQTMIDLEEEIKIALKSKMKMMIPCS